MGGPASKKNARASLPSRFLLPALCAGVSLELFAEFPNDLRRFLDFLFEVADFTLGLILLPAIAFLQFADQVLVVDAAAAKVFGRQLAEFRVHRVADFGPF